MYARDLIAIYVFLATIIVAQSRRWCAPELNRWITQKKVPMSWDDAKLSCERNGAVLASPLDFKLFNYMQSLINTHYNSAYFIGTRARPSANGQGVHYVSIEGNLLDNMPRAVYDAIHQLDPDQGECLSMDRHGIRVVSCWDHLPYICYSNEATKCGLGYTYYPATGSYYKAHAEIRVTWDVASSICAGEGAHLLVVNDALEADIVQRVMVTATGGYSYFPFIGLRDYRPGGVMDWRSVLGESLSDLYNVWEGGRPFNDTGKTCADFRTDTKQLRGYPCEGVGSFACELPQYQ